MEQKHIIVACGTGGVTSRNIAMKIEKYLKGKGVDCKNDNCKVVEERSKAESLKPELFDSATGVSVVWFAVGYGDAAVYGTRKGR